MPEKSAAKSNLMSKFGGGQQHHDRLLQEYKYNCVDVEALLSYYLHQMKVIEWDSRSNAAPVMSVCLNSLTDAVCVMLEMEDGPVSLASMALFILNNRKFEGSDNQEAVDKFDMIDAVLESRGRDQLDFGIEIED
jgi:hypothetical protein